MARLLSPDDLEAELRQVAARRYYSSHPFHRLLNTGKLTRGQVQAWALNRYYYQAMLPVKDAAVLARLADPADRRAWRQRILDQDGDKEGDGGLARWLKLTDGLGLDRDYVVSLEGVLPAVRFAVDAYVHFVKERTVLEAVASSLTELFSPTIASERLSGMLANYPFVSRETLDYFDKRLSVGRRDAAFALKYVQRHATEPSGQDAVIAAVKYKCAVLWSQLDALYYAYVNPCMPPPGVFEPKE